MKTIEDYMDDPSLADEPMPLREVHAVRMLIHDETRNMKPDELHAYYAESLEMAKKTHDIKVAVSAK